MCVRQIGLNSDDVVGQKMYLPMNIKTVDVNSVKKCVNMHTLYSNPGDRCMSCIDAAVTDWNQQAW